MKRCLILLIMLLVAVGVGRAQNPSSDRRRDLDLLADLLNGHQIERVEILHVSDTMETPIRITPETIRQLSRYRVVVERPWELSSFAGLLRALKEVGGAANRDLGEVRWAIIFFDTAGKERSAIFLSRDGKIGAFEGASLSLQGRLLDWSKGLIRSAFFEPANPK